VGCYRKDLSKAGKVLNFIINNSMYLFSALNIFTSTGNYNHIAALIELRQIYMQSDSAFKINLQFLRNKEF
jgi:hypothetical protein